MTGWWGPSAADEVLGRAVNNILGLCILGRMLHSGIMPGLSPNCLGRLACSALLSTLSRPVGPEGLARRLCERHPASHQVVPEGLTLGRQVDP